MSKTLAERLRALHCIACFNVITGKPQSDPCKCMCHDPPPANEPGQRNPRQKITP